MDYQILVNVLFLMFFLICGLYVALLIQFVQYKRKREDVEHRAKLRAVAIIEEARNKSLGLLEQAWRDAKVFSGELSGETKELAQRGFDKYKERLQKISEDVEKEAMRGMSEFKDIVSMQTTKAQDALAENMKSKFDAVNIEIDNYRREKYSEIDNQALKIAKEAALEIFGKSLDMDAHVELIKKSVSKAKEKFAEK